MEKNLAFYVQWAVEEKATENSYISIFFDIFYKNASPKEGWLYHVYFKKPFAIMLLRVSAMWFSEETYKTIRISKGLSSDLEFCRF